MRFPVPSANLLPTLVLFPAFASAFFINVPTTLTAGSSVTATWVRHLGDPIKFSMRLHKLPGDTSGRLVVVDSRGQPDGQTTLPDTVDVGSYIVEIFPENKVTMGGNLLASSPQIMVTDRPPGQGTTTSSPKPTTKTTPTPTSTPTSTPKTTPKDHHVSNSSGSKSSTREPKSSSSVGIAGATTALSAGTSSKSAPIAGGTPSGTTSNPSDSEQTGEAAASPEASGNNSALSTKTGIIVGGILGGIVVLLLLALGMIATRRRGRKRDTTEFYRDKMVRVRESLRFSLINPAQPQPAANSNAAPYFDDAADVYAQADMNVATPYPQYYDDLRSASPDRNPYSGAIRGQYPQYQDNAPGSPFAGEAGYSKH